MSILFFGIIVVVVFITVPTTVQMAFNFGVLVHIHIIVFSLSFGLFELDIMNKLLELFRADDGAFTVDRRVNSFEQQALFVQDELGLMKDEGRIASMVFSNHLAIWTNW